MSKVKICGLRRPEDIDYVNRLRPDYAGFILAEGRRRTVTVDQLQELRDRMDDSIPAVGVFVDQPMEFIAGLLNRGLIQLAQLHGHETEEQIAELRQLTAAQDSKIIRAFKVRSAEDLDHARRCTADYVLLDNGTGTGETFDWSLMENMGRHYFLAGGLDPDNVGEAVERFHTYALDVSSGVETDGVKDFEKCRKFMEAVKRS